MGFCYFCVFLLLLSSQNCIEGNADWPGPHSKQIAHFSKVANNQTSITDKVLGPPGSHSYSTMYGIFLLPLHTELHHEGLKMKMLEIGLGCGMAYGPGASVALWKNLFPTAELWEGEYDAACVEQSRAKGQLEGINVVTGDQGNATIVESWVTQTNGGFHAIIDDGGHKNEQIKTSFDILFEKALLPGGLYFIEDLQVGRLNNWGVGDRVGPITEIIQSWIEQLLIPRHIDTYGESKQNYHNKFVEEQRLKWSITTSIEFIMCQHEACVISKCRSETCVKRYERMR